MIKVFRYAKSNQNIANPPTSYRWFCDQFWHKFLIQLSSPTERRFIDRRISNRRARGDQLSTATKRLAVSSLTSVASATWNQQLSTGRQAVSIAVREGERQQRHGAAPQSDRRAQRHFPVERKHFHVGQQWFESQKTRHRSVSRCDANR